MSAALSPESSPVFISPAGTYGGDHPEPKLLASVDARVQYPGTPADPVSDKQSLAVSVCITILNGTGNGWFRAGYAIAGQDAGFAAGGFATVAIGSAAAATFIPDGLNRHGYLPAHPFTFGEPQTLELNLIATATGDVRPNHPGAFEVAAHAELTALVGYDGAADRFYSLTYRWEPA